METSLNTVSIIVPLFNEEENVLPLLSELHAVLTGINFFKFEIITVDDGSTDATYNQLMLGKKSIPELIVLRHQDNYGQSASLISGVRQAIFPWIITLDGDCQNDPADIPNFIAQRNIALQQNIRNILIIGSRKQRQDNWLRLLSSKIANAIRSRILKDDCSDAGCGLKLFEKATFLQLPQFNHMHRFLPALYSRIDGVLIHLPVNHRPRLRGQSKYGIMNRLWVGIVDLCGVIWLIRRSCKSKLSDHTP